MDRDMTFKESESGLLTEAAEASESVEQVKPGTWRDYFQLTKPGITFSNLFATFAGLWLAAEGSLDLKLTIFTLIGTGFVIASAATLNNYWDRELDRKMTRTQHRALASGRIHPRNALAMGIALLIAGLIVLTVFANPLTAVLGLIGHIFYVLIYTPLKRVTTLNTVIGGVSGAVPPMIGWVAVTQNLDPAAWLLFIWMFLWQPAHFLALAMLKAEDYKAGGIQMLPVVKGFHETKRQMVNYAAAMVPASLLLMLYSNLGYVYLVTALVLGLIYLVQLIRGFFVKDELAWARKMFGYSIVYLTCMCAAIIISAV